MIQRKRTLLMGALGVAGALLAIPGMTSAAANYFHGSACQTTTGVSTRDDGIYASSSYWANCNITARGKTANTRVTDSNIYVIDNNSSANTTCTLIQTGWSGNVIYSASKTTSGSSSSAQTLNFTPNVFLPGMWRYSCNPPGGSSTKLVSYNISTDE